MRPHCCNFGATLAGDLNSDLILTQALALSCKGKPAQPRQSRPGDYDRRNGMPSGTVKWFNQTKGYGFIAPDEGGADVFVHISAVQAAGMRGLNENQKVSYEMETGRNGKQSATNLKAL
jgi:CspA family cold shock protein